MTKNTNYSVKNSIFFRTRPNLLIIFIIVLTNLLSACQVVAPPVPIKVEKKVVQRVNYSQYYLWLKSLSNEQVLVEETKQELILKNQFDDKSNDKYGNERTNAHGKLILIYSLPTPEFYNPYKAKRLLNELLLSSNKISKDNLAFSMLLRDQLNAQLYLIQNQEKLTKSFNTRSAENEKKIEELNQQLNLVNQQLLLLIQIDQNINERG